MHVFARHRSRRASQGSAAHTKGLVLDGGWRYDLMERVHDTLSFRGRLRKLRQRTITRAQLQPKEQVLDVGCGTGTLALEAVRRVGHAGRVTGIDSGTEQITRARAKATRRGLPVEFQVGVIEQLPFPDQTFDVVFSTLMMHHLPASLKHEGLAEIARVLKPGGRLVLVDFTARKKRMGRATRFHAGGSSMDELAALVSNAGFSRIETEEILPPRSSAFPEAGILRASKKENEGA